jgi:hypothetical protein
MFRMCFMRGIVPLSLEVVVIATTLSIKMLYVLSREI